jgi:hypothetical protein
MRAVAQVLVLLGWPVAVVALSAHATLVCLIALLAVMSGAALLYAQQVEDVPLERERSLSDKSGGWRV